MHGCSKSHKIQDTSYYREQRLHNSTTISKPDRYDTLGITFIQVEPVHHQQGTLSLLYCQLQSLQLLVAGVVLGLPQELQGLEVVPLLLLLGASSLLLLLLVVLVVLVFLLSMAQQFKPLPLQS